MKNLWILILIFCVSFAHAQIQEGTVVVGGGLNLNGNNNKSVDAGNYDSKYGQGNFGISGSYEKFLNNTTAFGFFVGYNYRSQNNQWDYPTNTNKYSYREHMFEFGPKMSNYIPIKDKLYFTVESGMGLGIGLGNDKENDEKSTIWSVGVNARPGLAFFLNDNFALNASIGSLYYNYRSETSKEENSSGEKPKENSHSYGLSFNVNTFSIGLKYFLRTAKSD